MSVGKHHQRQQKITRDYFFLKNQKAIFRFVVERRYVFKIAHRFKLKHKPKCNNANISDLINCCHC